MVLDKDKILKADDLPWTDVEIPEWGGTVRVRTMTAEERDDYEASIWEISGDQVVAKKDNMRAKLLARCLVNEQGERLFGDKDIVALGRKSAKAMERLARAARDLNGLSQEAKENAEKK